MTLAVLSCCIDISSLGVHGMLHTHTHTHTYTHVHMHVHTRTQAHTVSYYFINTFFNIAGWTPAILDMPLMVDIADEGIVVIRSKDANVSGLSA